MPTGCARRSTSALAAHAPVDAPTTWVLSNHDVTRPVTRYGREDTSFAFESKRAGTPTDLARGTRRARAAALLSMALPGSMYVYQGEELGLPEVEDIPDRPAPGPDVAPLRRRRPRPRRLPRADPLVRLAAAVRVQLRRCDAPWLDQPDDWAALTVEAEDRRPGLDAQPLPRRPPPAPDGTVGSGRDAFDWLPSRRRRARVRAWRTFICLVNFGPDPFRLPAGADVLIASDELEGGAVPHDTTVWLEPDGGRHARRNSPRIGQGKEGR